MAAYENNSTVVGRARSFFRPLNGSNTGLQIFTCLLCNKILNGNKSSNLVSHLKTTHIDVYNEKVKPPDKESFTSLRIERLKLLQSLTRVTTIHQQPFNSLLKPGFQSIIGEKLRKLEQARIPLNLDSNLSVVKNYIHDSAASVRNKIKNEMKNRFFSLLADGVTKNNRSLLGISVQYVLNGVSIAVI